jgi:hypothetical protein
MKDANDREWYKKFRNYLDTTNIKYSVSIDYNRDDNNSEIIAKAHVEVRFEQFYNEVCDKLIKMVSNNINNLLNDIRNNVDNRIIDNGMYEEDAEFCYLAFLFDMKSDKELYEKLKNYLDRENIEYSEYIESRKSYGKLNKIEISCCKFV